MIEPRFAIGELASRGGVSRRTVRYYVQEGLLPSPFGLGRGNHYGPEHLERLLRIKSMQEAGYGLQQIRDALEAGAARPLGQLSRPLVRETLWRDLELAPGVHLRVLHEIRLPSHARLQELAAWCHQHMTLPTHPNEDDDA